jgi:hypothetical protein
MVPFQCCARGCQIAYFQTKNPNLGKFWKALQWEMLVYVIATWSIYGHLVYFVALWYILWLFGTFFPVLVSCTKKNLATLVVPRKPTQQLFNWVQTFSSKTKIFNLNLHTHSNLSTKNYNIGFFWMTKISAKKFWSKALNLLIITLAHSTSTFGANFSPRINAV